MPNFPPGYFLTWHTYGTWLHGDDAGSVDKQHNTYGAARVEPNPSRFESERRALASPPLVLPRIARILVDAVIRDHCRIRAWELRALAVRSNHVHVVIGVPAIAPEPIVKQLKEWGTRKLRSHRIIGPTQHAWADHASTIYCFEPGSLEAAIHYVSHMQQDVDESRAREDWDLKLGLRDPNQKS